MREIQLSLGMEKEDEMTKTYCFEDYLKVLRKIDPVAYAIIKPHAKVIEFSPDRVMLGFKNDNLIKKLDFKSASIDKASLEYFGKRVTFWAKLISKTEEEKMKEFVSNQKKKWTRKDKKYLRENYATLPNDILAANLNRTPLAVQLQASAMGVKKRPAPKVKRIRQEKKNYLPYFIIANIILCFLTLFILMFML